MRVSSACGPSVRRSHGAGGTAHVHRPTPSPRLVVTCASINRSVHRHKKSSDATALHSSVLVKDPGAKPVEPSVSLGVPGATSVKVPGRSSKPQPLLVRAPKPVKGPTTTSSAGVAVEATSPQVAVGVAGGSSSSSVMSEVANNILPAGSLSEYIQRGRTPQKTYRALVLDSAYRPINVATWFRAFNMAYHERAEVLAYYPDGFAWSGQGPHALAAVVRVHAYVDINDVCHTVPCNRRNVLTRDRYACVYCGSHRELSVDHVVPVCLGGRDTWTNLVTACMTCNQRKASHTLQALGWRLKRQPWEPTPWEIGCIPGLATSDVESPPHPDWAAYLEPLRHRLETIRRQQEDAGEPLE